MKLLGCHIENFGAFHDCDLTFDEGLNVIMQANGWGKTTLAAFVKAMLYGFDNKRKRDVAQNERLRYKPWQGGRYGGSLDFEAKGREYRVVRSFGTTGSRDSMKIAYIDTGRSALQETGDRIGEWLFGLDASAFAKSVYIVQNGLELDGSTRGLQDRLVSLVNEAGDVGGFESACAKLEDRRKYYQKTGNRGTIPELGMEIASLVQSDNGAERGISSLREFATELEGLDSQIAGIDALISEAQEAADEQLSATQRAQELGKVRDQLEARRQEALSAYETAASAYALGVPDDEAIDAARRDTAELRRLEGEADGARATAEDAMREREAIAGRYPNGVPDRQELRDMRSRLAEVLTKEEALASSRQGTDDEHDRISSMVGQNPGLIERADATLSRLGEVSAIVAAGRAAESNLRREQIQWHERRAQVSQLAAEAQAKADAVPDDTEELIAVLEGDAQALRSISSDLAVADARRDVLSTKLEEERAALSTLSGACTYTEEDVDRLSAAAEAAIQTARAAARARASRDDAMDRLARLTPAMGEAQAGSGAHQAGGTGTGAGIPAASVACLVLAGVAFVAGVAMGAVGPISFALYAAGIFLVAIGVWQMRGRGSDGPSVSSPEAADGAPVSDAEYRRAKDDADLAGKALLEAETWSREAAVELAAVAGELFPGETAEAAAVAARVPVLRQQLTARSDREKRVAAIQGELDAVEAQAQGKRSLADSIVAKYEGLSGESYADVATALESAASEIAGLKRGADESRRRLTDYMAQALGDEGDPGEADLEAMACLFERETPPNTEELTETVRTAEREANSYALELSGLLEALGLGTVGSDEIGIGAERLSRAVSTYRDGEARAKETMQDLSVRESQIAGDKADILAWAQGVSAHGDVGYLKDEWFASVESDIDAAERASWEEGRARKQAEERQADADSLRAQVRSFLGSCGVDDPADPLEEVERIAEQAGTIDRLRREYEFADGELSRWLSENEGILDSSPTQDPQSHGDAVDELNSLRQQRDLLVSERAQREEQRSAVLESLEGRLANRQRLELLTRRRQDAKANLFTVQKTKEYLGVARTNLDKRYLGDLTSRFADYVNAWLGDESVEASVTTDLGVELYDGNASHDVAGYSTGYRDLLDICFRMALVDTLFQAEPPFLIMDDPFSSLDEEKVRRAFGLMDALSSRYQVIYFTCHPSRTSSAAPAEGGTTFALPEQRERRELPRARARREAEESARRQAELVASYSIVPVTGGRASVAPATRKLSISSNLFSVTFAADLATGRQDNSFEVHFIDQKGRVLCDRQTIEVVDSHVVPENLRFSLTTHDDSGDSYDMIIHEDDRGPQELAARIPFKAEILFANDDFAL